MKKIITGVKPTGDMPHIGNLVGAILPFKKISEQADIDSSLFIADLHALTSVQNADKLKHNTRELALTYFSIFGLDTPVKVFKQSDIINIPKLNWILNNVTPYSLMLRAHSFKDFQQKKENLQFQIGYDSGFLDAFQQDSSRPLMQDFMRKEIDYNTNSLLKNKSELDVLIKKMETRLNMGVFNYPILMAADIIGYDIDLVPVGADQKQHLEMTRDIAKAFNKTYGKEIFKIPKEHIEKNVATIPGLDGRKMSKSYDNYIGIFDDEKTLKKKIMSISTDSKGLEDVKDPDTCNVFSLINLFGDKKVVDDVRKKYLAGGYGYGHAKLELFEILNKYLGDLRNKREELNKNYDLIEKKLAEGAKVMNERIELKMKEVKEVVGL